MKFKETFFSALGALALNKVRTFLTMLGVIIGVFSVVLLVSIVRGFQNYISDQFAALGSNLVFVSPGRMSFNRDPHVAFTNNKLDEKHVKIIENYAGEYITAVSPSIQTGKTVAYKTKSFYGTVDGSSSNTPEIIDVGVVKGRFYTKSEEASHAKVAVIGPLVSKNLFGAKSPIGKKIKIDKGSFLVIGLTKSKGQNFDDRIYIPFTTVKDTFDIKNISALYMKIKDTQDIDLAMKQIELAMLTDLKKDDFTVLSQKDILSSIQNILRLLTVGLGAVAGISLVVGGIGIMNIMLVSVTERIKEIGLRKALGATSFNIGAQFLIESVLISLSGGMLGVVLGWLATYGARAFVRAEVPWLAVTIALGFSMLVGIIFGTYPALQASKKDPIEALRYE